MSFEELKYAIESIAGYHGWEFEGLHGEWYLRFEKLTVKKKIIVDVHYNKKILNGRFPDVLLKACIKREYKRPENKYELDIDKLENIFKDLK